MTHIKNIPHILRHGITHKNSPNANPDYITIGDKSLINTREAKQVSISNSCPNVKRITLGNFIPFYFGIRMPMLYVMQHGGNFVETATPPSDIIYLACRLIDIIDSENTCYFSDGHATDSYTSFFDKAKFHELPNIINWNAITTSYWGGTENLNLKREKQAEFLVLNDILPKYLYKFCCYDENTKNKLINFSIPSDKIKVVSSAYY